jgi:hypothetical protein
METSRQARQSGMPADSRKHEQGHDCGTGRYLWHMRAMACGRMLGAGSVVRANPATKPAKKMRPKARGVSQVRTEREVVGGSIARSYGSHSTHRATPGVIQDANGCFAYLVDNIAG